MAGTITHYWDGTKLVVTSDSGTSSCDLKGSTGATGVRGCQGEPGIVTIDPTLSVAGFGADAKAVGDRLTALEEGAGAACECKKLYEHMYYGLFMDKDSKSCSIHLTFLSHSSTALDTFEKLFNYLSSNGHTSSTKLKMTNGAIVRDGVVSVGGLIGMYVDTRSTKIGFYGVSNVVTNITITEADGMVFNQATVKEVC